MRKIAYFSPLNPIRSGISDYSEDLLPELAKTYDIEIYISNGFQIENNYIKENFVVREYAEFPKRYGEKQYSAILYHMGNNFSAHQEIYDFIIKYPGIVVLHDYSLHHFFAAKTLEKGNLQAYRDEMLYCHGQEGLDEVDRFVNGVIPPIWENDSLRYPLNLRILDHSAGVIVHSQFAKNLLHEQASYVPIEVVPIPAPHISRLDDLDLEKEKSRKELNIDQNDFVISALGYANPTKRIDKIIEAIEIIKSKKLIDNIKFYIVGEIAPSYPLQELVKKRKLENEVIFTGYVELEDFDKYIAASDMCINLRYPTQGENSASLLKILGHGKPVIATNIGSFSEFPDTIVSKVSIGENEVSALVNYIVRIFKTDNISLSKEIIKFANENHTLSYSCNKYIHFIEDVAQGKQINIFLGMRLFFNRYTSIYSSYYDNMKDIIHNNIDELSNVFYSKVGENDV
ncbi:glycosyltransferase family 4 protein [Paenibacillus sp. GM2]|uniref:glycosyltransferase family 4 protein n=1 Tax=Paenibacillus sp. GM2 TaxID=1622070 RepID=UPI000839582D|nr:glycosyltransferase family 4 protein [Paenibacillus sp. GM2]